MVTLIIFLSFVAVSPGVGMDGMSPSTSYDFMITESPYVERFDLLQQAEEKTDKLAIAVPSRSIASGFTSLTMLYKGRSVEMDGAGPAVG